MALKIPTTQPARIAEVQRQAAEVLRLVEGLPDNLRLADELTQRCREIGDGAAVEYHDEHGVGVLLLDVQHRLDIAADNGR